MKFFTRILIVTILFSSCKTGGGPDPENDKEALAKTSQWIRDGFSRGDVPAIIALHHPDVIKYFGPKVVQGRIDLAKGLTDMFRTSNVEFLENKVESLYIKDSTAIETSLFVMKISPRNGGAPSFARGRSMVVYIRYKDSPTGWASVREMAQQAP